MDMWVCIYEVKRFKHENDYLSLLWLYNWTQTVSLRIASLKTWFVRQVAQFSIKRLKVMDVSLTTLLILSVSICFHWTELLWHTNISPQATKLQRCRMSVLLGPVVMLEFPYIGLQLSYGRSRQIRHWQVQLKYKNSIRCKVNGRDIFNVGYPFSSLLLHEWHIYFQFYYACHWGFQFL